MSHITMTAKEQRFIQFVDSYIIENLRMPTYREICDRMRFKSKRSVGQYFDQLAKKGVYAMNIPRKQSLDGYIRQIVRDEVNKIKKLG